LIGMPDQIDLLVDQVLQMQILAARNIDSFHV